MRKSHPDATRTYEEYLARWDAGLVSEPETVDPETLAAVTDSRDALELALMRIRERCAAVPLGAPSAFLAHGIVKMIDEDVERIAREGR